MAIITFPTFERAPASLQWRLQPNVLTHTSPFSGGVQTLALPGARWAFQATWTLLAGNAMRAADVFLQQMEGQGNRFYFSHPSYLLPRGTAVTGSVNGGGQTGRTLSLNIGAGRTLAQGDFIEVAAMLLRVTANVTADGAGLVSAPITPALRLSPSNGAALVLAAPKALFMLAGNDAGGVALGTGSLCDLVVDAIEAFE